jgi:hypothetical protein
MTRGSPRRELIPLESHDSIAVSWAKQDNCRVALSVSFATEHASIPALSFRDMGQRSRAAQASGVPKEIRFQTKPHMALDHIRGLANKDVPGAVVLADAAYGNDSIFCEGLKHWDSPTRSAFNLRPYCGRRYRAASATTQGQNRLSSALETAVG